MNAALILLGWVLLSLVVAVLLGTAIRSMGSEDMDEDAPTTSPPTDTLRQRLQHRAQAQAAADMQMPAWFYAAVPVVFIGTVLASAIWPWGFAA